MPISRQFLPFLGIFQPPEIFENKPHFFRKTSNKSSSQTLDTIYIIDEIDIIDTIKTIDSIKTIYYRWDRFDALIDFALLPRRKQR